MRKGLVLLFVLAVAALTVPAATVNPFFAAIRRILALVSIR
jgi:hypothetical protein